VEYFLVTSFKRTFDDKGVSSNSDDYINNGYWKISKRLNVDDQQLKLSKHLFNLVEVGDVLVLKEDSISINYASRTIKAMGKVMEINHDSYKFKVNWFDKDSWKTKHHKMNDPFYDHPRRQIIPINSDSFADLLFLKDVLDHMINYTNYWQQ